MPNGALIELDVLLVVVVRRVIGGDDVDAAVGDALQHGVAIGRLAQRRVHLDVGVVRHRRAEHLVGQHEMMRRHLAGDARRRAPCRSARRRASGARSCARCGRTPPVSSASAMSRSAMIDSASPGMPRSPSARRVEPFVRDAVALERLLLAVLDDRHVEHLRVLERPAHQQRRRHRTPVVGDRDAAGLAAARRCRRAARPSGRARRRRSDRRAPGSPRPPS